jgi:hypothetical protein
MLNTIFQIKLLKAISSLDRAVPLPSVATGLHSSPPLPVSPLYHGRKLKKLMLVEFAVLPQAAPAVPVATVKFVNAAPPKTKANANNIFAKRLRIS